MAQKLKFKDVSFIGRSFKLRNSNYINKYVKTGFGWKPDYGLRNHVPAEDRYGFVTVVDEERTGNRRILKVITSAGNCYWVHSKDIRMEIELVEKNPTESEVVMQNMISFYSESLKDKLNEAETARLQKIIYDLSKLNSK